MKETQMYRPPRGNPNSWTWDFFPDVSGRTWVILTITPKAECIFSTCSKQYMYERNTDAQTPKGTPEHLNLRFLPRRLRSNLGSEGWVYAIREHYLPWCSSSLMGLSYVQNKQTYEKRAGYYTLNQIKDATWKKKKHKNLLQMLKEIITFIYNQRF